MQLPASDSERSPDRYAVRLLGALAALLGRAEGAELWEGELLERMRAAGLITYPSPPNQHRARVAQAAMRHPAAAAAEHSTDRRVARLWGALAALLGRAEGAELWWEDELLGRLRVQGLITYPSPLLGRLLEELRDVLAAEVLPRLDSTDLALFARVGRASRAAAVSSGLPRAGTGGGVPLKLIEFCESVERLAWARENDCPWAGAYTRPLFSST